MAEWPVPTPDTSTIPPRSECPYTDTRLTYTMIRETVPDELQADAYVRMPIVLDAAIKYFECYTNVSYVSALAFVSRSAF